MTETAPIGHNNPPLLEVLTERFAKSAEKVQAIAARANAAPKKVETDADLAIVSELVRDARDLSKSIDKDREAEKAPFLKAGRDVDAFFKVHIERMDRVVAAFNEVVTTHLREQEAKRRAEAEREAAKARAEEETRRAAAAKADADNRQKHAEGHQVKANEAAARAEQAEAIAQASAADLTRTRHDSGVLTTARTEVTFEITDYDAIPLDKLRPYLKREHVEAALRAAVKLQKHALKLPGVRVFDDVKASIR